MKAITGEVTKEQVGDKCKVTLRLMIGDGRAGTATIIGEGKNWDQAVEHVEVKPAHVHVLLRKVMEEDIPPEAPAVKQELKAPLAPIPIDRLSMGALRHMAKTLGIEDAASIEKPALVKLIEEKRAALTSGEQKAE